MSAKVPGPIELVAAVAGLLGFLTITAAFVGALYVVTELAIALLGG